MIGISVLLLIFGLDGRIGRLEGLFLVAGGVLYTVVAIRRSRQENRAVQQEYAQEFGAGGAEKLTPARIALLLLMVVGGLALLVLGARWLVAGATTLAKALGLSDLIIGLTIVALGTSLPEVATSLIAALRGERDIAVGNVVGSNIFNILFVLGLTATVAPAGIGVAPAALRFDIPFMIAVAVACLPIFFTGYRIARWEGALFLAYYVAYTLYLILASAQHDALPVLSVVLFEFAAPLTAITLIVLTVRAIRQGRGTKRKA